LWQWGQEDLRAWCFVNTVLFKVSFWVNGKLKKRKQESYYKPAFKNPGGKRVAAVRNDLFFKRKLKKEKKKLPVIK